MASPCAFTAIRTTGGEYAVTVNSTGLRATPPVVTVTSTGPVAAISGVIAVHTLGFGQFTSVASVPPNEIEVAPGSVSKCAPWTRKGIDDDCGPLTGEIVVTCGEGAAAPAGTVPATTAADAARARATANEGLVSIWILR